MSTGDWFGNAPVSVTHVKFKIKQPHICYKVKMVSVLWINSLKPSGNKMDI